VSTRYLAPKCYVNERAHVTYMSMGCKSLIRNRTVRVARMAPQLLIPWRAQSGIAHQKFTGDKMNNIFLKLYIKIQDLMSREEGQDLVEYALIVALIALAATAGMKTLATAINTGFSTLGTTLNNAI